MIDTHCHVHDAKFDADRDAVITRARDAGINAMVTIGEDIADSARAIEVAQRYALRAAVGIHPHEAKNAPADIARELGPLLDVPDVVAIGETGLDYYYDNSPRSIQTGVLSAQIRLARETGRPVIFHHRDAFDDFTSILRAEWRSGMRGVIHCFTGNVHEAHAFVDEFGLLLGIGGVVTFPSANGLREAVRAVGVKNMVLETDCPYLAPVPVRGRRNEPAYIAHTAAQVSELLDVPFDELVATTDANAIRLFGL